MDLLLLHALWSVHSFVVFWRAFLTCSNGLCADTAATVNGNFRKKTKQNFGTEWTPHNVFVIEQHVQVQYGI